MSPSNQPATRDPRVLAALAALRPEADPPDAAAVEAVVARHRGASRGGRARGRGRLVLGVSAVTAALAAAFAFLPGIEPKRTDDPRASGGAVFAAAAAVAGQRPQPVGFDGYRYTRQQTVSRQRVSAPDCETPPPRPARGADADAIDRALDRWARDRCRGSRLMFGMTERQTEELWVDASFEGRVLRGKARLLDFEPGTARRRSIAKGLPAGAAKYQVGNGPLSRVRLQDLPTDPSALHAELVRAFRDDNWAPGSPKAAELR